MGLTELRASLCGTNRLGCPRPFRPFCWRARIARAEGSHVKQLPIFSALLLLGSAPWARAQDAPPPPPPESAGMTAPAAVPPDEGPDLRAEVAALREQVRILQQRLDAMQDAVPVTTPVTPVDTALPAPPTEAADGPAPPGEAVAEVAPTAGGRSLLLPDISFIGTMGGHLSNDQRDEDRSRFLLDAGEIAIQSYVYPGIKADAYIVGERHEDFGLGIEEAYLTAERLAPGLSGQFGKRKAAFGRVNQLHPHSWLYATQPYVLKNLVSAESLTGQGVSLSYLLPTRGRLFAQLDLGLWAGAEAHGHGADGHEEAGHTEDDHDEDHEDEGILSGPGAALEDRFTTLRLWTGAPVGSSGELELGFSGARGRGMEQELEEGVHFQPTIQITGVDLSYRRFGRGASRTLLRGDMLWHRATDPMYRRTAKGYYLLADQRLDRYRSVGLRYDWSEFPFVPDAHESAVSGIYTRTLTEQTYLRLQLTHGSRPGKKDVSEAFFQWVWGLGPHTHNLE